MRRSAIITLLALAACSAGAQPPYQTIDGSAEPLRTAFNDARGKVRAIFLASPT